MKSIKHHVGTPKKKKKNQNVYNRFVDNFFVTPFLLDPSQENRTDREKTKTMQINCLSPVYTYHMFVLTAIIID